MPQASEQSASSGAPAQKGLYGSDTGANIFRAAVAEVVGTAILVFVGRRWPWGRCSRAAPRGAV